MVFLIVPVLMVVGLVANKVFAQKTRRKTLAIVGASESGKTTFTKFLAHGIVGASEYSRTIADEKYDGTTVTFQDGTKLHIGDMKDLPGEPSAWLSWKQRVHESDHVFYLIRSHLLRTGRGPTRDRCRRDLQQLKLWLTEISRDQRPTVILVFSFRDKDRFPEAATTAFADGLIDLAGLKPVVDAIGRLAPIAFVSGSLASDEAGQALLEEIGAAL